MKTLGLFLLMAAIAAAQDRAPVSAQNGKPPASAESAPSLPKGAVEVEPNLYRFTDAHGKTWLTRRTPFGFSTWEDKPEPVAHIQSAPPAVKATDLGDSVRFQAPAPFGSTTWVRKKSDLSEEEKAWLAASRASSPALSPKPVTPAGNATEKQ